MKSKFKVLRIITSFSAKEMYICLLLVLSILSGCAIGPKVTDNTFSYPFPKIEARISPEFKYLGDVKYSGRGESVSGTVTIPKDTHAYIFVSAEDSKIKKMLSLEVESIRVDDTMLRQSGAEAVTVEYSTRLYDTEGMLDHGTQKLGRKSFKYFERPTYLGPGHPVLRFCSGKGYTLPNCVFLKVFFRPLSRTSLMSFMYLEDLSGSGYGPSAWGNIRDLTADQKSYVDRCRTNCMNSFDVLR